MIFDQLKHAHFYHSPGNHGRNFRTAFEWLCKTDLHALPPGRVEIDGDEVFALPQEIITKPREQCRWEGHRKYADIQLVVAGIEQMGVAPLDALTVDVPYDPAKDVAFFAAPMGTGSVVTVPAGSFAVFFPARRAHAADLGRKDEKAGKSVEGRHESAGWERLIVGISGGGFIRMGMVL